MWETLSADIWARTRNPWLILHAVSQRRLAQLAQDEGFRQRLAMAVAERRDHLDGPAWFQRNGAAPPPLVAYFCLEYGIAEALPLYSGGLGILAGDHLKAASDLGAPIVGVGLLYKHGYGRSDVYAVANFSFLTQQTNLAIGKRPPEDPVRWMRLNLVILLNFKTVLGVSRADKQGPASRRWAASTTG